MERTTRFPRRSLLLGAAALTAALVTGVRRAGGAGKPTVTVHKDPT